jgi:hypothetical protein
MQQSPNGLTSELYHDTGQPNCGTWGPSVRLEEQNVDAPLVFLNESDPSLAEQEVGSPGFASSRFRKGRAVLPGR